MAGTASSSVRSAYVAEATAGTIPASPGFTTMHRPAIMSAPAEVLSGRSLVAKGARMGHAVQAIPVSGTLDSPLIYGVYDTWLETLLQGAWSANVLKDAQAVKTVAVENTMAAGVGGTSTMLRYRGVEAIGGKLALASNAPANLSLTLAGRGSDVGTTTALSSSTYTNPTEADPLSSGTDVGTITAAGYTLDCFAALDIDFAFEGRDTQPKIASDDLCGIARGSFLPVLTAKIYVEANFLAIYNAARARHSAFAVAVPLGSVTGEKYTLSFPVCKFGAVDIDQSGANLLQTVQILPQYDTSSSCVLSITRAVA